MRSQGVLNDQLVDETLRDVRLALLEAHVNVKVVKALLDKERDYLKNSAKRRQPDTT